MVREGGVCFTSLLLSPLENTPQGTFAEKNLDFSLFFLFGEIGLPRVTTHSLRSKPEYHEYFCPIFHRSLFSLAMGGSSLDEGQYPKNVADVSTFVCIGLGS